MKKQTKKSTTEQIRRAVRKAVREALEAFPDSAGHNWFQFRDDEYNFCRKCGIVQRADRGNSRCSGWVKIGIRNTARLSCDRDS